MVLWPVVFAVLLLWIAVIYRQLARARRQIAELNKQHGQADRDYLTGLLSQATLRERLDSGDTFTGVAIVCDLDDFKLVNDRLGHLAGDDVLRDVGKLILASVRLEDQAYRWGGDEFTILLHDSTVAIAEERMNEIAQRLLHFRLRGQNQIELTISWGIAASRGELLSTVLEEADRAMYKQKNRLGDAATTHKVDDH